MNNGRRGVSKRLWLAFLLVLLLGFGANGQGVVTIDGKAVSLKKRGNVELGTLDDGEVLIRRRADGGFYGKVSYGETVRLLRREAPNVYARGPHIPWQDEDGCEEFEPDAGPIENDAFCTGPPSCKDAVVDLMIVYTKDAAMDVAKRGQDPLAAAEAAVDEMNLSLSNAGIAAQARLVYVHFDTDYVESGSISTDLMRLRSPVDGYLDYVHGLRDTYGADVVSMVVNTGGCGVAFVQIDANGNFDPSLSFNVVSTLCMLTNRTLAHEVGHNLGMRHDWYVNPNDTPCPHAHGYVNKEAFVKPETWRRWRTIMSYNNECAAAGFSCARIAMFSAADQFYLTDPGGIPLGRPEPADGGKFLPNAMCKVAAFRGEVEPPPPPPPPPPNQAPVASFTWAASELKVTFTDASYDPDGSIVKRNWQFGDGATSTATNPVHTYPQSGSYTTTLVVTDNQGATGSRSESISVTGGPPPPPPVVPAVTYPVEGSTLYTGQVVNVTWENITFPTVTVSVVKVEGKGKGKESIAKQVANTGSASWRVQSKAGSYRIEVANARGGGSVLGGIFYVVEGDQLSAYPTPANPRTLLSVHSLEAGPGRVEVYDALGRRYMEMYYNFVAGDTYIPLDMSEQVTGLYYVRVTLPNRNRLVHMISVVR